MLVVEDSDEDFEAIERAVRRTGLARITRAVNADAGLALLRRAGPAARAAMVLLDLNTPGSDGREILREIKNDASLKRIPVIVFSSSANPRDLHGCYADGANSYHVKPLPLREFEAEVVQIAGYWLDTAVVPPRRLPGS